MILSKIDGLCSVVRHERINRSSQLTLYGEFTIFGAPIVIEKALYVNVFVRLSARCLERIDADSLDLDAHLGCRRNTSTHTGPSVCMHNETTRDIRALGWCPDAVTIPQFYFLVSVKQFQPIPHICSILKCDFYITYGISDDLNWSEAPHGLNTGLGGDQTLILC